MNATPYFERVLSQIERVIHTSERPVSTHEPQFAGNEWTYVKECLDTGWVSSVGKYVDLFEQRLVEYTGAAAAISVVNGTAALQMTCILQGVKPGDEVLMPALTFVATANSVTHIGGIPHFVDSERETLGVDPVKLRSYLSEIADTKNGQTINKKTGRPIRALVAVHIFGHPVKIDELMQVCRDFGITWIEDAAESLGSTYKGRAAGTFSSVSALSFNGNKVVTTGGGGALLFQDVDLAKKAKHLTTTAKQPHKWAFFHDQVGYNYRMPNINAALGVAQLEQLPGFLKKKRALADSYRRAFADIPQIEWIHEPKDTVSNYWLNAILLKSGDRAERDAFLSYSHSKNIFLRPAWDLLHTLPMYQAMPCMDLTQAKVLEATLINLPSGSKLGAED